jgi:hypothetical protein
MLAFHFKGWPIWAYHRSGFLEILHMSRLKYTNAQIIAALATTKGMVYLAAKNLGCHPDTIFKRARRSPAVQTAIDAARGEVVDTAELALYDAILRKEGWAIAFALRTIGRHRGYVEKTEHELSGELGVRVIAIGGINPDEDI